MTATGSRASAESGLGEAGVILDALVRSMAEVPVALPDGTPNPDAAEARLLAGIPGLEGEPLVGWSGLLAGMRAVARGLETTPAGAGPIAIVHRLERTGEDIDGEALTASALAGAWDLADSLVLPLGVEADTTLTLLDYAARPSLRAGAAALRPLLARVPWGRGRCPACGTPPALAVVHGKERERRLCCGRCGTTWGYERVRCPSCGERTHDRLGALHAAGQGEFRRADVCDGCGAYVKSVAVLDLPGPDRVLTLDLETAALDFLAMEQGYRPLVGVERA